MNLNPYNTQMVDLRGQFRTLKSEIVREIMKVIESSSFIKGEAVHRFENNLSEYLGVKHVIGCANGTDALQIALMCLDLPPNSEILVPDFTFIATAEVVALLGHKPVFVDVDPEYFNMCPKDMKQKITSKTKAIMPVHLFGQCAPMDEIMAIAKRNSLFVVEDAAQALGAVYKAKTKAGTIGHIGTTSFFPSKNLGAFGDGGAIFTNDDILAEKIKSIANHGMQIRYHHDHIGINSRLDSLQAAVLDVKLKRLDKYNKARRKAADGYDKLLKSIPQIETPARAPFSDHIFHQYTICVEDGTRDALHEYLKKYDIPNAIYYPIPLHKQKAFEHVETESTTLSVSTALCSKVMSLPMHTELIRKEQAYIVEVIKKFYDTRQ